MKYFFAIALLGAITFADDASDKASVVDKDVHGITIGTLENAIAADYITIKTGTAGSKGTLKLATGWRKTTGSDAETYMGFSWEIVPTDLYDPKVSTFSLVFAKDKSTESMNYTKFGRTMTSSSTYFNYNYAIFSRSLL